MNNLFRYAHKMAGKEFNKAAIYISNMTDEQIMDILKDDDDQFEDDFDENETTEEVQETQSSELIQEILLDIDSELYNNSVSHSTHTLQTMFVNKIRTKANQLNATKIITNENLASILQDISGYIINPIGARNFMDVTILGIYQMGSICGLNLFVNPELRWSDNEIFLLNNDDQILYAGKVIDSHGVLL